MSKTRALGLLAVCIALVVFCVGFYPSIPAEDRAALVGGGVVGLAVATMLTTTFLPRSRLRIEPDGSVLVRGARWRFALVALCASAAALALPFAGSAGVARGWESAALIWFVTVLLAAIGLYQVWLALRSPALWRLDSVGVECLTGVRWQARWSAVAGLQRIGVAEQMYLALLFEAGQAPEATPVRGLSRLLGVPEFAIGAQGASCTFEDMEAHAIRLWRTARGG